MTFFLLRCDIILQVCDFSLDPIIQSNILYNMVNTRLGYIGFRDDALTSASNHKLGRDSNYIVHLQHSEFQLSNRCGFGPQKNKNNNCTKKYLII